MARADLKIIAALRNAAERISKSDDYQWGHMGSCNCGFLTQQITRLSKAEIHHRAMQRYGDWNEQINDYCPASGLPFDSIIDELLRAGLDIDDLKHLERLSDPLILAKIEPRRFLAHNSKEDVIAYLLAWAAILESELLDSVKLSEAFEPTEALSQ